MQDPGLTIPNYRVDVQREIDVIEEIFSVFMDTTTLVLARNYMLLLQILLETRIIKCKISLEVY